MKIADLENVAARLRSGEPCVDEAADLIDDAIGEIERLYGSLRAKEYAMKIRDRNATLEGDETCYVMPSGGLEIIGEDGRALFSIEVKDGILKVQTGTACKHGGKVLDNRLVVIPHSANYVSIARPPYEA